MKKRNLFSILIAAIIASSFSGCEERAEPIHQAMTNNAQITVDFLFENDGCKVYRFVDNGRSIYYTNCTGKTQYSYSTGGKTPTTHHIESLNVGDTIIVK